MCTAVSTWCLRTKGAAPCSHASALLSPSRCCCPPAPPALPRPLLPGLGALPAPQKKQVVGTKRPASLPGGRWFVKRQQQAAAARSCRFQARQRHAGRASELADTWHGTACLLGGCNCSAAPGERPACDADDPEAPANRAGSEAQQPARRGGSSHAPTPAFLTRNAAQPASQPSRQRVRSLGAGPPANNRGPTCWPAPGPPAPPSPLPRPLPAPPARLPLSPGQGRAPLSGPTAPAGRLTCSAEAGVRYCIGGAPY